MGRFFKVTPTETQSAFVEQPLDFMYQALQGKQQQLDTTKAGINSLTGLYDIKVDPYDLPTLYKKQAQYNQKIDELSKELNRSGNTTQAIEGIQNLRRDLSRDEFHRLAPIYYEQIQKDKQKFNEAVATGKVGDYNQLWNQYYGKQWYGTQGEDGTINQYNPGNLYFENQDHWKKAESMMDDIKASGWKNGAFQLGQNGEILKWNKGGEGIAKGLIEKHALSKRGDFLNSTEGKDFIRQLQYNYQMNGRELTSADVYNEAYNYLYKAGMNQIYSKSESDQDYRVDSGLKQNQIEERLKTPTTIPQEFFESSYVRDQVGELENIVKNLKYNDKGEVTGYEYKVPTGEYETYTVRTRDGQETKSRPIYKTVTNNVDPNFKNGLRTLATYLNPDLQNASDNDLITNYFNSRSNLIKQNIKLVGFQKDQREVETDQIMSSIGDRKLIPLDKENNTGKPLVGIDVYKQAGYTGEDISGKNSKTRGLIRTNTDVIGYTHLPDGDKYKTYKVIEITNKNTGKRERYAVQPDEEFQGEFNNADKFMDHLLRNDISYFKDALEKNTTESFTFYDNSGNRGSIDMLPIMQLTEDGQMYSGTIPTKKIKDNKGITHTYVNYIDDSGNSNTVDLNQVDQNQKQSIIQSMVQSGQFYNQDELYNMSHISYTNSPYYLNMRYQSKNSSIQ